MLFSTKRAKEDFLAHCCQLLESVSGQSKSLLNQHNQLAQKYECQLSFAGLGAKLKPFLCGGEGKDQGSNLQNKVLHTYILKLAS